MRFVDCLAASLVGALIYSGLLFCGLASNESTLQAKEPQSASVAIDSCDNPDCTCENCDGKDCKCNVSPVSTDAQDVSPKVDPVDISAPIIYFFTMGSGCQGCVDMLPVYEQLKAEGHETRKLDVMDGRFEKFVDYYNVGPVPQFITVDQNGYEIRRTRPGVVSKATILGQWQSVLDSPIKTVEMQAASAPAASCSSCSQPRRVGRWRR